MPLGTVNPAHVWGGEQHVVYRDFKGSTYDAQVLGPGTTTGVKLQVWRGTGHSVIDNVPKATTPKSTNVYFFVVRTP
ncbi:MAG TPA: hypothetical protein VM715_04615 [Candidatus Acidoferrum sp.]|nr:hypothetical protein [Candidatus Acidoferrum sp.]